MPYLIRKKRLNCFEVINSLTGEVKSECTTRLKAEAQVRLLRGMKHGMIPRRNPVGKFYVTQEHDGDVVDLVGPFDGREAAQSFAIFVEKYLGDDSFDVLSLKSPDIFMSEINHLVEEDER